MKDRLDPPQRDDRLRTFGPSEQHLSVGSLVCTQSTRSSLMTNHSHRADGSHHHGIVVGIDGSGASSRALSWAFSEAERRSVDLDVVIAWTFPYQFAEGFDVMWREDSEYFAKTSLAEAENAVDHLLDGKPRPPWLHVHAIEGAASVVLLNRAKTAEMLVVGTRGRGGFRDLLLGSVSTACVHHTPCPIAVIPCNDQ